MKLKQQLIRTTVCWVALSGWLLLLNPTKLPVFLLVVPFVLLYFALYELCILFTLGWQRLAKANLRSEQDMRRSARFITLFLCFIAILGSLGQLVVRDVVTLLLLFLLAYFYLLRGRKSSPD